MNIKLIASISVVLGVLMVLHSILFSFPRLNKRLHESSDADEKKYLKSDIGILTIRTVASVVAVIVLMLLLIFY